MSVSSVELTSLVLRPSSGGSVDLIARGAQGRVIPVYAGSAEKERPDRFEVELTVDTQRSACREALEEVRAPEGAFDITLSVRGVDEAVTLEVRLQGESFMKTSTLTLSSPSPPGGRDGTSERLEVVDREARDTLATLLEA